MAERKHEDPEKAAKTAAAEAEPSEDAESFPVDRLIADGAELVGEPPHVVAGALHGINKKTLTVEEAQAACKAWLRSPVKEA